MGVVDAEHDELVGGEVRAQPVEAVQDGERRVGRRRRRLALLQRPGQPEHARGQPRRALQQIVALGGVASWSIGSKSWRTTPKAKSRSSSAPRARRKRVAPSSAESRAAASTADLPIPAGPSTTTLRPDPSRAAAIAAPMHASSRSRSRRRSTP